MGLNQGWVYREQIQAQDAGQTVLEYYATHYRHSSRAAWYARIQAGQVHLDGHPIHSEACLRAGQWLAYHRPPWQEPVVPLDFRVQFEDAHVMVIEKPSGLPVLPGGGFLTHTLLAQLRQRYPGSPPIPIHRLGRGTSGLMLLAKSPLARARLSQQLRDRTLGKVYRALVGPGDFPTPLTLTQPIGPVPHPTLGTVHAATPTGRAAVSHVRVLQRRPEATLLSVTIETGRPHQIRIHLAAAGFPLLGDPLYGPGGHPQTLPEAEDHTQAVPGDCGYHLHAYSLTFAHPVTQATHFLCCPPPPLLQVGAKVNGVQFRGVKDPSKFS